MLSLDIEQSRAIVSAAEEIMTTTGQLWVTLGDEEFYIPELIEELNNLEKSQGSC